MRVYPLSSFRVRPFGHDSVNRHIRAISSRKIYWGRCTSDVAQQAKAIFFRRYRRDGGKDYLVCAVPGDRSADLEMLRGRVSASRLRLATPDELQRVTGCRFGELPPVGSIFGVELVLDERLLSEAELYFNAGRLDRSFIVEPAHLVALEQPVILRTASQQN